MIQYTRSIYRGDSKDYFGEVLESNSGSGGRAAPTRADAAGSGGYDGDSCTESGAAREWKKSSNPGCTAKIRFSIGDAH